MVRMAAYAPVLASAVPPGILRNPLTIFLHRDHQASFLDGFKAAGDWGAGDWTSPGGSEMSTTSTLTSMTGARYASREASGRLSPECSDTLEGGGGGG